MLALQQSLEMALSAWIFWLFLLTADLALDLVSFRLLLLEPS